MRMNTGDPYRCFDDIGITGGYKGNRSFTGSIRESDLLIVCAWQHGCRVG
jgi:hypothetical protein